MGFARYLSVPLSNYNPKRPTEVYAVYRVESLANIKKNVIKNSINFNREEQLYFITERLSLIYGFDNIDVEAILSNLLGVTVNKVNSVLDTVEAKCYARDLMGIEVIPKQKYTYDLDNFWDIFFDSLVI